MSLFDNSGNGMYMPVAPAGNGGYGSGGWGDGSFWIIVLFIFAIMGNGWGNGYGGGNMMPFMMNNTNNDVQRGFDQQAVVGGITGVNTALNALAMNQTNQLYNAQTAIDARLDNIAMAQQNCCCENRAATADVKYTVANEAAATRANTDAKVQMVMDKLCQLELDGVKQNYENRIAGMQNQIDDLRLKVNDARFDASQNAQTATIQAGQRTLANEVEQYVLPTARPAYIVQNPNCCQNNYGWSNCGCATA